MALGIARTAIETFNEIAGAKTTSADDTNALDNHGAQVRVSRRSRWCARPGCFCSTAWIGLWSIVTATGDAPMEARAHVRLAASHAVSSAVQAVDLVYIGPGRVALHELPLERAFRDVHAITQHIGVHPRVMETTGRVLSGWSRTHRSSDNRNRNQRKSLLVP